MITYEIIKTTFFASLPFYAALFVLAVMITRLRAKIVLKCRKYLAIYPDGHKRIVKRREFAVATLNSSNRLFISGVTTFFVGIGLLLTSPFIMEHARVLFDNDPVKTMSCYVLTIVGSLVAYCISLYVATGIMNRIVKKEKMSKVRSMNRALWAQSKNSPN